MGEDVLDKTKCFAHARMDFKVPDVNLVCYLTV